METMFKGFETEDEWEEALKDQNEHLKKSMILIYPIKQLM